MLNYSEQDETFTDESVKNDEKAKIPLLKTILSRFLFGNYEGIE